jgi:hypothetical protein
LAHVAIVFGVVFWLKYEEAEEEDDSDSDLQYLHDNEEEGEDDESIQELNDLQFLFSRFLYLDGFLRNCMLYTLSSI